MPDKDLKSNDVHIPVPDPTVLTTEAQERADKVAREWVESQLAVRDERLERIDLATQLRAEAVADDIAHARELAKQDTEHAAAMTEMRFTERDIRLAEAATSAATAVSAAFAAQKEAVAEQNKSNTKAIDKSETATAETLRQITVSFNAKHDALTEKVDDIRTRLNGTEGRARGVTENRTESRESRGENRQNISTVVAVVGLIVTLSLIFVGYESSQNRSSDTTNVQPDVATMTVTTPAVAP